LSSNAFERKKEARTSFQIQRNLVGEESIKAVLLNDAVPVPQGAAPEKKQSGLAEIARPPEVEPGLLSRPR